MEVYLHMFVDIIKAIHKDLDITQEQLAFMVDVTFICCELLSIISIFDIRNNCLSDISFPFAVVNCFQ